MEILQSLEGSDAEVFNTLYPNVHKSVTIDLCDTVIGKDQLQIPKLWMNQNSMGHTINLGYSSL